MVLGFLRVGLGAEATVLALRGGAEALAGDSKGPLLNVELETTSPRGCCESQELGLDLPMSYLRLPHPQKQETPSSREGLQRR